jgi:hypothetical protein
MKEQSAFDKVVDKFKAAGKLVVKEIDRVEKKHRQEDDSMAIEAMNEDWSIPRINLQDSNYPVVNKLEIGQKVVMLCAMTVVSKDIYENIRDGKTTKETSVSLRMDSIAEVE